MRTRARRQRSRRARRLLVLLALLVLPVMIVQSSLAYAAPWIGGDDAADCPGEDEDCNCPLDCGAGCCSAPVRAIPFRAIPDNLASPSVVERGEADLAIWPTAPDLAPPGHVPKLANH